LPAELTVAQLRALRGAVLWTLEGEEFLCDFMPPHAGRNWYANLRKAAAEISRELALQTFGKGGKRA